MLVNLVAKNLFRIFASNYDLSNIWCQDQKNIVFLIIDFCHIFADLCLYILPILEQFNFNTQLPAVRDLQN